MIYQGKEQNKSLTVVNQSFIDQCLDYFGSDITQVDILQEECAELIKACSKAKRLNGRYSYSDPVDQLKEEMAHVLISLEIVARIYGITVSDITDEVLKKAKKYNFKKIEVEELYSKAFEAMENYNTTNQ